MNLKTSDYVWISYGWYFEDFWMKPIGSVFSRNCTTEQIMNVVNQMLLISTNPWDNDDSNDIIGGLVSDTYVTLMLK